MVYYRQKPTIFNNDVDANLRIALLAGIFHLSWFSVVLYAYLGTDRSEFIGILQTLPGLVVVLVFSSIFLLYPLLVSLVCVKGVADCVTIQKKKRTWQKNAASGWARIVDRKEEYNDYAESREEQWDCELAVIHPCTTMNSPGNPIVWVKVSDGIYNKYKDQDTAHIYYDLKNPYTFIIEGE
jgi:hypothetical protein